MKWNPWFKYIDPSLSLNSEERTRVKQQANAMANQSPAFAAISVASVVFALLGGIIYFITGSQKFLIVFISAWIVIAFAWSMWWWGKAYSRATWQTLRELGHDVCPCCGYLLKSLNLEQTPKCPECGWDRDDVTKSVGAG